MSDKEIKNPHFVIQDENGDTWLVPMRLIYADNIPFRDPDLSKAERSDAPLLRNASVCERVFTDLNRENSASYKEDMKRIDEEHAAEMKRIDDSHADWKNRYDADRARSDAEFTIGGALLILAGWAILSLYFSASPTLAWWQGIIAGGILLGGFLAAYHAISWGGGKLTSALATWHLNRKARKETAP